MAGPLNEPWKLALRGVAVQRGRRVVLDVPRLEVRAGESLAIIGPNGAGKSTLLLQLALLDRPARGSVLFDGEATRGHELALRRRMAVVFQQPLLLDRSVGANVEMGLRMRGVPSAERNQRTARWLERFGVGGFAGRSARTLSGGEAQRVSLARAFALEPEVLLLDEPFSALDTPTRGAIIGDLGSALAGTRVTTVLVTHDHDEAARLGDRAAVLIGGQIRQIGAPAEVFGAPADEAVAAFVGVETMIPATVVGRQDGLVALSAGTCTIEAVADGVFERALVCLRPEDVTISGVGEAIPSSARNKIVGRVRRIVPTGADARVEVDCGGFPLIARLTRRSIEDLGLAPGVDVVASFKATAVHLIPK